MMIKKLRSIFINNDSLAYITKDDNITFNDLYIKANDLAWYLVNNNINKLLICGNKEVNTLICMLACFISGKTYIYVDKDIPSKRLEYILDKVSIDSSYNLDNKSIDISNIEHVDELLDIEADLESIAYIMFTSGSTGKPKGVPISFKNLYNFINWIINVLGNDNNKLILNTANFNFDLSIVDIYYSWYTGNTLTTINNDDINIIVATPTYMKMLLLESNYKNLDTIYLCGEYLDKYLASKILKKYKDVKLINAYGPTECTSAVSSVRIIDDMLDNDNLPIGDINTFACNIEIIDSEIVISGDSVFSNYLGEDKVLEKYHTKDLGYIDNNYLYFKGRMDNQVKLNGYRIEILEIENVIKSNKNVEDAVVIPRYDNMHVKWLDAYIVLKSDDDIKAYLESYLPSYMIPKNIIYVDKLKVSDNKKIIREGKFYD